jgi:hypothetical protein
MDEWDHAWSRWAPVLEKEFLNELDSAPAVSDVHGLDHVKRVWQRCKLLGRQHRADPEVLLAAAYLHDLGRHYIRDEAHGALGAQMAEPVLIRIGFPVDRREKVLHAIRVHDVSATPEERTTMESIILYDADKVDSFGVIGVPRQIQYHYHCGIDSIDFILKDNERRWQGLALPETRRMALDDYEYITNFFLELKKQLRE